MPNQIKSHEMLTQQLPESSLNRQYQLKTGNQSHDTDSLMTRVIKSPLSMPITAPLAASAASFFLFFYFIFKGVDAAFTHYRRGRSGGDIQPHHHSKFAQSLADSCSSGFLSCVKVLGAPLLNVATNFVTKTSGNLAQDPQAPKSATWYDVEPDVDLNQQSLHNPSGSRVVASHQRTP